MYLKLEVVNFQTCFPSQSCLFVLNEGKRMSKVGEKDFLKRTKNKSWHAMQQETIPSVRSPLFRTSVSSHSSISLSTSFSFRLAHTRQSTMDLKHSFIAANTGGLWGAEEGCACGGVERYCIMHSCPV